MCVIFHEDNARLHVSLKTWQKLLQLDLEFLIHPSYSKGVDPLDFHLFQFLQNSLNGKKFSLPGRQYLKQFFAQKDKLF